MKHVYSGACRSNLEQIIKVLEFVNIKEIQSEASVESGGPGERPHRENLPAACLCLVINQIEVGNVAEISPDHFKSNSRQHPSRKILPNLF